MQGVPGRYQKVWVKKHFFPERDDLQSVTAALQSTTGANFVCKFSGQKIGFKSIEKNREVHCVPEQRIHFSQMQEKH